MKIVLPIIALLLILSNWFTTQVKPDNLLFHVNSFFKIPFFETCFLYLYLLIFTAIPSLSMIIFDTQWLKMGSRLRYSLPAIFIVAVFYWVWDIYKTKVGVWGFNPKYYTVSFLSLPIEEYLFFIIIPLSCLLIYDSLDYFRGKKTIFDALDYPLSMGLIFIFFTIGLYKWAQAYTATTWLLAGFLLLWQVAFDDITAFRGRFFRAFLVVQIPFLLVNGILTGAATAEPVVVYNPEEYFGVRIGTIPIDDFVYNFTMLFSIIWLYEKFQLKKVSSP